MEAKDLQKALHILAWIIIWIVGLIMFFLLLTGLTGGLIEEFLILFFSIAIGGSISVLFLFTLEYIVKALDVISTNSYVAAKFIETNKISDEK